MSHHLLIQDRFSKWAPTLRKEFDTKFANDRGVEATRFVWDYWHVPNQYTLLRTPAYHYFNPKTYMSLHRELVDWGRKNLGCWDISPPWLSCYVEGCHQNFHSDVPHGAWAFVYSLSPKRPVYRGGETLIMKPEVLSYWQNFADAKDREVSSFIESIKSDFNRLVVFDPRLPHGVSELKGTHDPREGRLVIHGWFTQPKTYREGPLPAVHVEKVLNEALQRLLDQLDDLGLFEGQPQGTAAVGLLIDRQGRVKKLKLMTKNIVDGSGRPCTEIYRQIQKTYRHLEFKAARSETWITLPLIFSNAEG